MFGINEKSFILESLERAQTEHIFEELEAIYSEIPPSSCRRCAICCQESPRIYFVEFLKLYRTLTKCPRWLQMIIQERSVRYSFLDLCDATICCPILEENRCLLYEARGLRCRLWGHQSHSFHDQQISTAKKHMAKFAKLFDQCGLYIPAEVFAKHSPYCRATGDGTGLISDEDARCLEERLRRLECRFLGTTNPDDRCVDFARQLYVTLVGLRGYGAMRVRAMREYLERTTEEELQPLLEHVRSMMLL